MSASASPKPAPAPKHVGIPQRDGPDNNKDSSSSTSGSPPEDSRADLRTGESQIPDHAPNRVPEDERAVSYAREALAASLPTDQYFSLVGLRRFFRRKSVAPSSRQRFALTNFPPFFLSLSVSLQIRLHACTVQYQMVVPLCVHVSADT
jgi:hypothetical protein